MQRSSNIRHKWKREVEAVFSNSALPVTHTSVIKMVQQASKVEKFFESIHHRKIHAKIEPMVFF